MRKEKAIREIIREGDVRKKSEDVRECVETLARIVDHLLFDAAAEKGISDDAYADALRMIGEYTDQERYDVAFDLMFMLSSILDRDAQMIMENLNEISEDAAEIFLEYFSKYIEDWYVIEAPLQGAIRILVYTVPKAFTCKAVKASMSFVKSPKDRSCSVR